MRGGVISENRLAGTISMTGAPAGFFYGADCGESINREMNESENRQIAATATSPTPTMKAQRGSHNLNDVGFGDGSGPVCIALHIARMIYNALTRRMAKRDFSAWPPRNVPQLLMK